MGTKLFRVLNYILKTAFFPDILFRIFGWIVAELRNFLRRSNLDKDNIIQIGVELDAHLALGLANLLNNLCSKPGIFRLTHEAPSLSSTLEWLEHASDSVIPRSRGAVSILKLRLKQFQTIKILRILIYLHVPLF